MLCGVCPEESCKGRSFQPDPSSARCIDWQKLRLQELLGADQQQQGKVPRTVEVSKAHQQHVHMWCQLVHCLCSTKAAHVPDKAPRDQHIELLVQTLLSAEARSAEF